MRNTSYHSGLIPPQKVNSEKVVLGFLLWNPGSIAEVLQVVPGDEGFALFYIDRHAQTYMAMLNLHREGKGIDVAGVHAKMEQMYRDAPIGTFELTELQNLNSAFTLKRLRTHIGYLVDARMRRELIKVSTELMQAAYEPTEDPFTAAKSAEKKIKEINSGLIEDKSVNVGANIEGHLEEIKEKDARIKLGEEINGSPYGILSVDYYTGGSKDNDLIIVGARPSMGKTAWALCCMVYAAMQGIPQLFFSWEMDEKSLLNRLLATAGLVSNFKVQNFRLDNDDWSKLDKGAKKLVGLPLYIEHIPNADIDTVVAKAEKYKKKYGIRRFWGDYIQLVPSTPAYSRKSRHEQLGEVSNVTKRDICDETTSFVWLAQVKRDVDNRMGRKIPMASDLKDCGSFEQDADLVAFLWRPSYYIKQEGFYKVTFPEKEYPHVTHGFLDDVCYFVIPKQRNGPRADIPLHYDRSTGVFQDGPTKEFYMNLNEEEILSAVPAIEKTFELPF